MGEENVEQQVQQQDQSQTPQIPSAPIEQAKDTSAELLEAIRELGNRIQSVESKISQPSPIAANPDSDIEKEIQLRKDQLGAIKRGEIDSQFEPEVISRLSQAEARKLSEQIMSDNSNRSGFIDSWQRDLNDAYTTYPDLKDPNSELSKEVRRIVSSDPVYQKHLKIATTHNPGKVNYQELDSRINRRIAAEAYAEVQRKKDSQPRVNSGLAKTALEGKTVVMATPDELSKLEQKASESGDQNDWLQFFRTREKINNARKQQVV